jgi:ATP-dependent Clp protease ATP-binding subunit ClpA
MFERFTDKARRVVVLAQEESRRLNHNYIGTEHLLLGLLREPEGVGAKALESVGISLDAARVQVEEFIGKGETSVPGHIPFTPRAKKVLELALRESKQLGHNYIGTEHILLGVLREGEGVAAEVLRKLGAELGAVRQQVVKVLTGFAEGASYPQSLLEVTRQEFGQKEPADAPACPRCRAPLKETIASGVLAVGTPEGEEGREVQFVLCLRCGTWLGTIPPA